MQRDAPDANRGRSFARFESRFQVVWVLGAVVPAAVHLPFEAGAIAVAVVGAQYPGAVEGVAMASTAWWAYPITRASPRTRLAA